MSCQKTLLKSIILLTMVFVSCEKDISVFKVNDDLKDDWKDPLLHNTCTEMIDVKEGEVLFSLILSDTRGSKDAVVYYSSDNMDFDKSVYLTAGLNILDSAIDAGPAKNGIKITMPAVCIKDRTEIIYYFRIVRKDMEEKTVHISFETLRCGYYRVTDSNINMDQDFLYYIKANEYGDPDYFNVKFN